MSRPQLVIPKKTPEELALSINEGFTKQGLNMKIAAQDFLGKNFTKGLEDDLNDYEITNVSRGIKTEINRLLPTVLLFDTKLQSDILQAMSFENPKITEDARIEEGIRSCKEIGELQKKIPQAVLESFTEGRAESIDVRNPKTDEEDTKEEARKYFVDLQRHSYSAFGQAAQQGIEQSEFLRLLQQRYIAEKLARKQEIDSSIISRTSEEDEKEGFEKEAEVQISANIKNFFEGTGLDLVESNQIHSNYNWENSAIEGSEKRKLNRSQMLMNKTPLHEITPSDVTLYKIGVIQNSLGEEANKNPYYQKLVSQLPENLAQEQRKLQKNFHEANKTSEVVAYLGNTATTGSKVKSVRYVEEGNSYKVETNTPTTSDKLLGRTAGKALIRELGLEKEALYTKEDGSEGRSIYTLSSNILQDRLPPELRADRKALAKVQQKIEYSEGQQKELSELGVEQMAGKFLVPGIIEKYQEKLDELQRNAPGRNEGGEEGKKNDSPSSNVNLPDGVKAGNVQKLVELFQRGQHK